MADNVATVLASVPPMYLAAAAAAAAGLVYLWSGRGRKPRRAPTTPPDRVVLYVTPFWAHGPNPSPGCAKVETALRLMNIPYTIEAPMDDGPTGRWPFIAHNGRWIADSGDIIEHLMRAFPENAKKLADASLNDADKALGLLLTRTCEQAMYFGIVRTRWVDNFWPYFAMFKFEKGTPTFIVGRMFQRIRNNDIIPMLDSQGNGARTDAEYQADLLAELTAVSRIIASRQKKGAKAGSNVFFTGTDVPSIVDATVFAYVQNVAGFPYEDGKMPEFARFARTDATLQAFLASVKRAAFPDWEAVCARDPPKAEYAARV